MAQLAIKGHKTRGKEVIEILEMLGAKNCDLKGYGYNLVYYIRTDGYIGTSYTDLGKDYKVFTLEEFLKKFSYKIGDKVQHKGATSCGSIFEVEKMRWEEDAVKYTLRLWGCNYKSFTLPAEYLQPYKEETMEETDTMNHTTEINLNHPCFKRCNEIEIIIPDGWEFKRRDNKMFGVRKQYPKTYEECCKVLQIPKDESYIDIDVPLSYNKILKVFTQLLICRDAYWKIAGEQMGLGKPWEPDWDNEDKRKHVITCQSNNIIKDTYFIKNTILAFPTAEMRDAFYENFKDLIEEAKNFYNV